MQVRLAALICLALTACLTTYSSHVERVRSELVGLEARALSGCLPVPSHVQTGTEYERLTYQWAVAPDEDLRPERPMKDWKRERADRRDEAQGIPTESEVRSARHRGLLAAGQSNEPVFGYCELTIDLRDGRVAAVRADGRTSQGLNWDADCLMVAEPCVEDRLAAR